MGGWRDGGLLSRWINGSLMYGYKLDQLMDVNLLILCGMDGRKERKMNV